MSISIQDDDDDDDSNNNNISGRLCRRIPPGKQVVIRLGHRLSSMRTTCPYEFKMMMMMMMMIVIIIIIIIIIH